MKAKGQIPRRTFLRGAGTCVALPFLEAMMPATAQAQAARPMRAAFIFHPNGWPLNNSWRVESEPYVQGINALSLVAGDYTLLYGLSNPIQVAHDDRKDQLAGDGHGASSSTIMTGQMPKPLGNNNWGIPTTADQVIAQQKFGTWKFPSLGVNVYPKGSIDTYHQPIYTQNIFWKGPSSPVKLYDRPLELFNLMFAGGTPSQSDGAEALRRLRKKSVLDFVLNDLRSFRNKLGSSDKQRLEEYLTSLEKTERDIAAVAPPAAPTCSSGAPPENLDMNMTTYVQRYQIFQDLMVTAFRCDLTRVFQFMVGHETMPCTYVPGLPTGNDWHSHSHDNYSNCVKVMDWHMARYRELILKMKAIREPDGNTLLDNSLLLFYGGYGDAGSHSHFNQQIFMAGRGGGRYKSGVAPINGVGHKTSDLWLTLIQDFGINQTKFGDSSKAIAQIRAA